MKIYISPKTRFLIVEHSLDHNLNEKNCIKEKKEDLQKNIRIADEKRG